MAQRSQDGKGALANSKKLYADQELIPEDLDKEVYTISEQKLKILNEKLATFDNEKLTHMLLEF